MPARATQPAGSPAGQARVQVTGPGAPADADTLEVCISGMLDSVEKHLDPRLSEDAWTTAFAWFRPAAVRQEGQALLFDLEPAVTWHLRPHTPYVLRLRDGAGLRREERLTWIAIRLPSQAPHGYEPPVGPAKRPAPAPAAGPAPVQEAAPAVDVTAALEREAAAAAALAATQRRRDEEALRQDAERKRRAQEEAASAELAAKKRDGAGRSRSLVLGGAVAALLIAAGAAGWVYRDALFGTGSPPAVVAPTVPTTLEGARQFLAGNPGADESFGLADRFLKAKQLDGAFLLLRNAAGKGNAAAALELGAMYDPETYTPETSPLPAPNAAQAADWYKQAADAGIAEAQYRYGKLLMSGKTAEPNGPELGVAWLRKAADQGLAKAKEALPK